MYNRTREIHLRRLGAIPPEVPIWPLGGLTWKDTGRFSVPQKVNSEVGPVSMVAFGAPAPAVGRPGWIEIGDADGGNYCLMAREVDEDGIYLLDHEDTEAGPRELGSLTALLAELIPCEPETESLIRAGYPLHLDPTVEIPRCEARNKRIWRTLGVARTLRAAALEDWPTCAKTLDDLLSRWQEPSYAEAEALGRIVPPLFRQGAADSNLNLNIEWLLEHIVNCESEVNRGYLFKPVLLALAGR